MTIEWGFWKESRHFVLNCILTAATHKRRKAIRTLPWNSLGFSPDSHLSIAQVWLAISSPYIAQVGYLLEAQLEASTFLFEVSLARFQLLRPTLGL